MPREKDNGSTATIEETETMFPELDMEKPEHKALMAAAKRFHKEKVARDEMKTTAKQKEDQANDKLVELMHAAKLTKFKHNGITVETIPGREKARVKIATDDEDEDEGDDE